MPGLDVNEVLTDPDLSDTFSVRRSQETVGTDGRTTKTPELFEDLSGVIVFADGELTRSDDQQAAAESIAIVTPFSLRDASFGYQPDVVIWGGSEYLVKSTKPFRRFGRGFTKATAVSTRATDAPSPD